MTDNIVQFRKKKPVEPQKQSATPGLLKKLLVVLAVAAAFALAFTYFSLTGAPA